jgi:5-methylcytosine-specific restriction endonuclease McrA
MRRSVSQARRFAVLKRDRFQCQYCGRRAPHCVLEVDHRLAVANGGSDDPSNLVTACRDCNRGKGTVRTGTAVDKAWEDDTMIQGINDEDLMLDGDPWIRAIYGELVV